LHEADKAESGASVFAYRVRNPQDYGVVEFDANGQAISLEEKPSEPKSAYAVTGLYFYDEKAPEYAKQIKPSSRGELEITDLNRLYLEAKSLKTEVFGRGFAWLDTGTHASLLAAAQFIQNVEERQGLKIACLEEIAFHQGWLSSDKVRDLIANLGKTDYATYLTEILAEA
jgi:glucose-1-phosphate thymidylyltransferase